MKQTCLILCFLSHILVANCQLDASTGVAFRSANGLKGSEFNFWYFRLDVKKNHWIWNNEISFCKHQAYESSSYSYYSSGGGSSATFYSSTSYNSFIRYTPLVIREGVDYSFDGQSLLFKKGTASLRFGAFLQLDIPLEAEEYGQICISVAGNNSNINHVFVETQRDTSYNFTSATPRMPYVAIGLKCSRHIYFQHFFIGWQVGIGGYYKSRFQSTFPKESAYYANNNLERQQQIYIKPFAEFSFGIGYRFHTKKEKGIEPSVGE
jgi:hypothetical protein